MKIVVSDADRFYKQTEMQEKYPIKSKVERVMDHEKEIWEVTGYIIREKNMYVEFDKGTINYKNMERLTRRIEC